VFLFLVSEGNRRCSRYNRKMAGVAEEIYLGWYDETAPITI
jgi:hypothetical protein